MKRCVRYFGIFDYEKIWSMSWAEYQFLWEGYVERHEDEMEKIHLQAWLDMAAQGQKKQGKGTVTAFPKFEDFYKGNKAHKNPSLSELKQMFEDM